MTRQLARSYRPTTSPTYLPSTDARTNVVLDRIVVCALGGVDDTLLVTDGSGTTLLEMTMTAGQPTPFSVDVGVSSGSGMRVNVGSASSIVQVFFFNSSRRHELPNGY